MQRKHVLVLTGKNFVAHLRDKLKLLVAEAFVVMVGNGRGLLQNCISRDHLARHEIGADAEVLQGTLRLGAPELVRRNLHLA